MDEKDRIITAYDMRIRMLVSFVQAFINHEKDPGFFGLPSLEWAERAWKEANDFNVKVFEYRAAAQNDMQADPASYEDLTKKVSDLDPEILMASLIGLNRVA